ncbi:MAG: hypothetical protein M2R45_05476 [Verrucomicrobia subdivision 3 bacterium]|nr:hypothetical protein [Limisphaerales bacterium]
MFSRLALPSAHEISQRHTERHRLAGLYPEEYYNPDYLKGDPRWKEYSRKVFRHYDIQDFLTWPHKDEPPYRQALILLLENGYDIGDWPWVVSTLLQRQMPTLKWKAEKLRQGFPIEEIEREVARMREQDDRDAFGGGMGFKDFWRGALRIDDPELIDALAALEFDLPDTWQLPAEGTRQALKSERLLTDEDWLDNEFRAAIDRYEGEPQLPFMQRQTIPLSSPAPWE